MSSVNDSLETKIAVLTVKLDEFKDLMESFREGQQKEIEKLKIDVASLRESRALFVGLSTFGGAILAWLGNLIGHVLTK